MKNKQSVFFLILCIGTLCAGLLSFIIPNAAVSHIVDTVAAGGLLTILCLGSIGLASMHSNELAEMEETPKKYAAILGVSITGIITSIASVGYMVLFCAAMYQDITVREATQLYAFAAIVSGVIFYFAAAYFTQGKKLLGDGIRHLFKKSSMPVRAIGLVMLSGIYGLFYVNSQVLFPPSQYNVENISGFSDMENLTRFGMYKTLFAKNNVKEEAVVVAFVNDATYTEWTRKVVRMTPYGIHINEILSPFSTEVSVEPVGLWIGMLMQIAVLAFLLIFGLKALINRTGASLSVLVDTIKYC